MSDSSDASGSSDAHSSTSSSAEEEDEQKPVRLTASRPPRGRPSLIRAVGALVSSSAAARAKSLHTKDKCKWLVDTSKVHPLFYLPCLKKCAEQLGFVELCNTDKEPPVGLKDKINLGHVSRHVDMHWHDRLEHPITRHTIGRLSARQRCNRFFRMIHLAKKNPLAKVLNRLQLLFPLDYNFHPLSFQFPEELPRFKRHAKRALQPDAKPHAEGDATDTDEESECSSSEDERDDGPFFILKPDAGCKGRGIKLAPLRHVARTYRHMRSVRKQADEQADEKANGAVVASERSTAPGLSKRAAENNKPAVIQEYLRPYLLNGHKFDFRLYVVVAGVNPLQAYLCRTGMVRRCMSKYSEPTAENANQKLIHLTNTAHNSKYTPGSSDDSSGSDSDDDSDDGEGGGLAEAMFLESIGCKRLMTDVLEELKADGMDTHYLWESIKRVVGLTMNAIHPELAASYVSCFQVSEVNSDLAKRVATKRKSDRIAAATARLEALNAARPGLADQLRRASASESISYTTPNTPRKSSSLGMRRSSGSEMSIQAMASMIPQTPLPTPCRLGARQCDTSDELSTLSSAASSIDSMETANPSTDEANEPLIADDRSAQSLHAEAPFISPQPHRRSVDGTGGGPDRLKRPAPMPLFSDSLDGHRCCQLLGVDVLLNDLGDPYVIEINHNPSFKIPTPLDEDIKTAAMCGALAIASAAPMSSTCAAAKRAAPLFDASQLRSEMNHEHCGQPKSAPGLSCHCDGEAEQEERTYNSKDWALQTWYDRLLEPRDELLVFDRARKLLEAMCTEAIAVEHEAARRAREEDHSVCAALKGDVRGVTATSYGSSNGSATERSKEATQRHGGTFIYVCELPEKNFPVLCRTLVRARLPRACAEVVKGDGTIGHRSSLKAVFGVKRTPFSVVMTLEDFCEGLITLGRCILQAHEDQTPEELVEMDAPDEKGMLRAAFDASWEEVVCKGLGSVVDHIVHRMSLVV